MDTLAFVQSERFAPERIEMLAATILSGIPVGLPGSGAKIVLVGDRARELFAAACVRAQEFLDGLD